MIEYNIFSQKLEKFTKDYPTLSSAAILGTGLGIVALIHGFFGVG